MKPNQSNSNDHPPTVSASSPQDNPCLGSDPNIAALEIIADDGISYLLPYAQFLSAERFQSGLGKGAGRPAGKNADTFCHGGGRRAGQWLGCRRAQNCKSMN